MSVITTYFAAPDDAAAAAVIDWPTGPVARPDGTRGFPNVDTNGIDPFILIGALEQVFTGRTYAEVTADPRHG